MFERIQELVNNEGISLMGVAPVDRFEGAPLAAMKSLDEAGRVIYCGTFSKLLFPSLRISYAVLPDQLIAPFTAALSLTFRHVALIAQTTLHEFIAEGHFGRHVRRMRLLYAERAQALGETAGTAYLAVMLASASNAIIVGFNIW